MSPRALLAEFGSPEALVAAAIDLRRLGMDDLDTFTPYPLPELELVLGIRRSRVSRWVLAAGLSGGALAYLLEWWCSAVSYPLNVGARPLHSAPAFIPITFESAILSASLAAFVFVLWRARLIRLYDPVFEVPGFERASIDRFWLAAPADGRGLEGLGQEEPEVRARLLAHGALQVVRIGDAR